CLSPGGVLIVKDVDTRPAPKRWFTWTLDKLMAPATPVRYWSGDELAAALRAAGFQVRRHAMLDFLPYPHVIYIATRRTQSAAALTKLRAAPRGPRTGGGAPRATAPRTCRPRRATRGCGPHSGRRRTAADGDSRAPRSPGDRPDAGAPGRTDESRR